MYSAFSERSPSAAAAATSRVTRGRSTRHRWSSSSWSFLAPSGVMWIFRARGSAMRHYGAMTKLALAATSLAFVFAFSARAAEPDWNSLAEEDTIEIVTHDEDGDVRETPVWLGVLDGVPYVRTTESRWLANIGRDPNVVVRVAGAEFPLRADAVVDADLRARVNAVFREKYGFMDAMLGWFGNDGGKTC